MQTSSRLCSFISALFIYAVTLPADAAHKHTKHKNAHAAVSHLVSDTRIPPCVECSSCHSFGEKPVCEVGKTDKYVRLKAVASWYGGKFHGRKTASGERFNKHAMTAAHRTLPLGSKVKVTNIRTGDSVVVKINDRGPYVRGRGLDLSQGAAEAIHLAGTERVEILVLERGRV